MQDEVSWPCPHCGSLKRYARVRLNDFGCVGDALRSQARRAGESKWFRDTKSGDDFTRDLDSWGHRTIEMDRDHNLYRELIELYDGSWLESTAMLDNHRD